MNDPPIISYLPLAAVALLAAGLAWAPLPFGSVEPWAESLLRLLAAAALAAAAAVRAAPYRLRRVAVPGAALGALALLGWLQSLPLPGWLVGLVSPRHAEAWGLASELVGRELAPRLTLAPEASRDTALAFAAAAAALLAAALVSSRRGARVALLLGLLAGTLFPLGYGLRRWLAGSREIWGVELVAMAERLRGTFVNPNHFAVQLEIGLAATFAWGWWALRRARRAGSVDRGLVLVAPPAVLWLLLFGGLALTGSRAGLLAALIGVTIQASLSAPRGRRRHRLAIGLAVGLAGIAAVVATVGLETALGRLLATTAEEAAVGARARTAAQSLALWLDHPLAGSGLGTYRDAFPAVQQADQWTGAWHHAHNDWLELLVTGGLVGAALLAVGLGALLLRLLAVLRSGRRSEERAAALAALGAVAALAVHEAFDFGLTLPAHAFTLAVVCGAAAGGSRQRRDVGHRRSRTVEHRDLDEVHPGGEVGGELVAAARPLPEDGEQPAVDVDLQQARGMALAEFEDDAAGRCGGEEVEPR